MWERRRDGVDGTAADGVVVGVVDRLRDRVVLGVVDVVTVGLGWVVAFAEPVLASACATPTTIAMAPKPPTARPSATARAFSAGWGLAGLVDATVPDDRLTCSRSPGRNL